MIIESQAVGPFFKNGYVVSCETTREAILIDPGDEISSLLAYAQRQELAIRHILLTHAHVDHVTGVAAAKRALNVRSTCIATIYSSTNGRLRPAGCSG
jgi:glyoxylase-like metal-dependent hydrolase (beta-lactamase superfamily II)